MAEKTVKKRITIGLFIDDIASGYHNKIWESIVYEAARQNINLLCFLGGSLNAPSYPGNKRNYIYKLVKPENLDGLIVFGSVGADTSNADFINFFNRFKAIPCICINEPLKNITTVLVDNFVSFKSVVEHLVLCHNYKKIAFIGGPPDLPEVQERYRGYSVVLKNNNINLNPDLVFYKNFLKSTGQEAIRVFLDERKTDFDAIACANDNIALGAKEELKSRNISIPDDIAIAGFDDIDESWATTPSLTTVRQPLYDLGVEALKAVIQIINGKKTGLRIMLPAKLKVRRSCGCYVDIENNNINDYIACNETNKKTLSQKNKKKIVIECEKILRKYIIAKNLDYPYLNWAEILIESFLKTINENKTSFFIIAFEKFLFNTLGLQRNISELQKIIIEIFNLVKIDIINGKYTLFIKSLWEKIKQIILENILKNLAYQIGIKNEIENDLYQTNQALITSFNLTELKKILCSKLPFLGIKSCYLSIFNQIKLEYSHYYLFSNKSTGVMEEADEVNTTGELIPENIFNHNIRKSYILIPLIFLNERLGSLIIEIGSSEDPYIYESLAMQISSALKGAVLLKKVEDYTVELEKEVDKKTANLLIEIKEKEKAQRELFKEKERVAATLQSIGDGVLTTDKNGIITSINPAAVILTGWDSVSVINTPIDKVLNIFNKITKRPYHKIISRVIAENRTIKLYNLVNIINKNNEEIEIKLTASPLRNNKKEITGVVVVFNNISETERIHHELKYQSTHDMLTGLYNRSKFYDLLNDIIKKYDKTKYPSVICYIDIDDFKIVNNACGDIGGDELIRYTGNIIRGKIRNNDLIARLGSNQFGVILDTCKMEAAFSIIENIFEYIKNHQFVFSGKKFKLDLSIGLLKITQTHKKATEILNYANIACSVAKKKGGNCFHVYSGEDEDLKKYQNVIDMLPAITKALEEDKFTLYFQEIQEIEFKKSSSKHYEILLRMLNEDNKIIYPGNFIPAAEQYNLMANIDKWVVKRLFKMINNRGKRENIVFNINLSATSVCKDDFLNYVISNIEDYKILPESLCFEITETAAISNFTKVINFINELRKIRCTFSLDDFGSGFVSFEYLKSLPVDYLKIDGSYVKGIANNTFDYALVDTINNIGHVMNCKTVAEYVENKEILDILKGMKVDFAQGYYIHKPEELSF